MTFFTPSVFSKVYKSTHNSIVIKVFLIFLKDK